jgi:hypothetical protein
VTLAQPAKIVVAYGGGVNSVAMLALLHRVQVVPTAITMADPGSEWAETYRYRDIVVAPFLARVGFPPITVVTRMDELRYRRGGVNFETLRGCCERTASLPSVAYPPSKKCSQNYKAAPQRWWLDRQEWAHAEWAAGRKIAKAIGYDTDEPRRIRASFGHPDEDAKCFPWYPVFEAGLDRDACMDEIRENPVLSACARAAGLDVVPRKSACTFCPNNSLDDWHDLYHTDPDAFADAVAMSRAADTTIESPDVVGLLRGFAPHGKRSLHRWVDGEYGDTIGPVPGDPRWQPSDSDPADAAEMPCECRS